MEKPGSLCRPCEATAREAVGKLGDDYLALKAAILHPRGRIDGPKVHGTAEQKIPIPLDVDTVMSDIDEELHRWARVLTAGEPLPWAAADHIARCAAIVCSRLDALLELEVHRFSVFLPLPDGGDALGAADLDGVDAVLRLARLHHRALTVLGLAETTTWLPEPCHMCGLRALTVMIEAAIINCRGCHQCWDQDEFARLNNPLGA